MKDYFRKGAQIIACFLLVMFLAVLFSVAMNFKDSFLLHDSEENEISYRTKLKVHSIAFDPNKNRYYFFCSWRVKDKEFIATVGLENLNEQLKKAVETNRYRFEAKIEFNTKTKKLLKVKSKIYRTIFTRKYKPILRLNKKLKGTQIQDDING